MSPYDVTKLTGVGAMRPAAHDTAKPAMVSRDTPKGDTADKGVAVQTGARVSAGNVPVDNQRVSEIRTALREGTYPIVPAEITDAIIAARLMLSTGQ